MYHFKDTGGGEGGETVASEELTGGDAHDGWGPLGTIGKDRVTHGIIDALRERDGDGFVELLIDLFNQGSPVAAKVER